MNKGWGKSTETCGTGRMKFQTEGKSQIKTRNTVFEMKDNYINP